MRRALFISEFRSALLPNLVTVGAILGTLVILERVLGLRFGRVEDFSPSIDFMLLAVLVTSGFISGERCFPTEFKEQRIFFLFSLPISRSWVWLTVVSGRFSAAMVSLGLTFALRRPLKSLPPIDGWSILAIVLLISAILSLCYLLLFVTGTLFALLFRRPLFAYTVGYPFLGFLLIEIFFASSYLVTRPQLADLVLTPPSTSDFTQPPVFLAISSCLLLLSVVFLSWRFFVRGEINNPRRRIRSQLLFSITMIGYFGFVFGVTSNAKIASVYGTWTWGPIDPRSESLPCGIAANGRYLFAFETLERSPVISRVNVVDTRTGNIHSRLISEGVGWGFWSGHNEILNLLVLKSSPLSRWGYLIPGTLEWIRLTPELREISQKRFKEVTALEIVEGGRAIVYLQVDTEGRALLLDGASGKSSRASVFLGRSNLTHEVPWLSFVWRSALISDSEAKEQSVLRRQFNSPSIGTVPVKGRFLIPYRHTAVDPPAIYFLDDASRILWVRSSGRKGQWEKLPNLAGSLFLGRTFPDGLKVEFPLDNAVDFASGISASLTHAEELGTRLFIYDPLVGLTLGPKVCSPGEEVHLYTDRVSGLNGVLIVLNCMGKSVQTYYFEYIATSREIRAIPAIPIESRLLYVDNEGREVWLSNAGKIWLSSPSEKQRLLWPPQAGNSSR